MALEIDMELVRKLYVEDLMHPAEIGPLVGASQRTIERRLKEHGIERDIKITELDSATLQRIYCDRDVSLPALSQALGVSLLELAGVVVSLGLPLREKYLDRGWLLEQLETHRRDPDDIARECGVQKKTIYEYMKLFGISRRQGAEPYHDPVWCRQQHYEEGKSIKEIARSVKRSPATITEAFRKHEIEIRGTKHAGHKYRANAPYRNETLLRQLYEERGLSDDEVAQELGCNRRNVQYWRNKYGIKGRALSDATELRHKKNPEPYKDCEWCEGQYVVQQKSTIQIAEELGCSPSTVRQWLVRCGIALRASDESYHLTHANSLELSPYLCALLEGELLGDGSLVPCSKYSAVYGHASKHKAYVEWLSGEFASQGMDQSGAIREMRVLNENTGRTSTTYVYRSLCYPVLMEWRNRFYPEPAKKKIVPDDLVLDPIRCRQWYIGDGRLARNSRQRPTIVLYTCAFDSESVGNLRRQLSGLGFEMTLQRSRNQLYMPADSVPGFLDYIGDCPDPIRDVYGYKWDLSSQ